MHAQARRLWHWSDELAPNFHWAIGTGGKADAKNGGEQNGGVVNGQHSHREAPFVPPITGVSTSRGRDREDDVIEFDPVPNANANSNW